MMSAHWKKKSLWIGLASFFVLAWVAHSTYRALSIRQEVDQYRILQKGEVLPPSTPLVSAEGKYSSLQNYEGKVLLLNFWASWCAPCVKEMPSLYALHERFKEKGFAVLAISMDEDIGQGMAALTGWTGPPPFPIYKGNEQAIFHRFPIEGLPHTVVLDRKGVIQYSEPGERDWSNKESVELIEGLL